MATASSPPSTATTAATTSVASTTTTTMRTTATREEMWRQYTPWVMRTYGDAAKTKTITRQKYRRIVALLQESRNDDNTGKRSKKSGNGIVDESGSTTTGEMAKFRLWAKSKGFHLGAPKGHPSTVLSDDKDQLYLPTGTEKSVDGKVSFVYKRVAVVEDFFDIIYSVHVEAEGDTQLRGRAGKHCGQKRTYRAVADQYAFIPREAISKFLLYCTECAHKGSVERRALLNALPDTTKNNGGGNKRAKSGNKGGKAKMEVTPDSSSAICSSSSIPPPAHSNGGLKDGVGGGGNLSGSEGNNLSVSDSHTPVSGSSLVSEMASKGSAEMALAMAWQHYCPPLMRQALGLVNLANLAVANSAARPQLVPLRRASAFTPTAAALAMMTSRQQEVKDDSINSDASDSSDPDLHIDTEQNEEDEEDEEVRSTSSERDVDNVVETSDIDVGSNDNDDNDNVHNNDNYNEEHEDKMLIANDDQATDDNGALGKQSGRSHVSPLQAAKRESDAISVTSSKAFDLFVRLFVDENLDVRLPLCRQPRSKLDAIVAACSRQFPHQVGETRRRIGQYLKSCRRESKRSTITSPPSPDTAAVVARACENEAENAKRLRLGLQPQTQPSLKEQQTQGRSETSTSTTMNMSEAVCVRQLIGGYRESAAFLLRSADELEQLINVQQMEEPNL